MKLCHKALAECHHFPVRLALGIKIRTALAAADWKPGQGIFKNLFKAKEFDNTKIYAGM
jgi:hypothetical protein